MRVKAFYTLYVCFLLNALNCSAQQSLQQKDSAVVTQLSGNFFNWYIGVAKAHKQNEYNPVEVQDKNGMTTLDSSIYMKNLKRLSFSDSLMKRERLSYEGCILKLSKIKYVDYLKLTDLDDFEELEDDFTNYYRWTGGQEMYDGYTVSRVTHTKESIIVYGRLYDNDSTSNASFGREIQTVFMKQGSEWKIFDIKY